MVRRWTTWQPAAFLAGLFYGFSPFVIESLTVGHVNLATLVAPPLVVICLDELLVRQRGRAWAWGLLLGGLVTLQFFISSEILVMCALAATIGVVLVVAWAAVTRRGSIRSRASHAVAGLGTAAVTAGALLAYPAWYSIAGPRPLPRQVWPDVAYYGSPWRTLLLASGARDRGPNAVLESYGYFGSHPLLLGYLGIGMVAVLGVGLVLFHRDRLLWFCAAMLVVLEAMSLGAGYWPWRILHGVPIVENVVPNRIAAVGDLFAAAMLGVIVDRARGRGAATRRDAGGDASGSPADRPAAPRPWPPLVALSVAWGLAAVALLPIAWQYDLPFTTRPVSVPAWFTSVGRRVPTTSVVLTYPFPSSGLQAPMAWQAAAGLRFSMVGGGGIAPAPPSHPTGSERNDALAADDLAVLSYGWLPLPTGTPAELARLRRALHDWGVTDIVVPKEVGTPRAIRARSIPLALAYVTAALGRPPVEQDGSWVWSVPEHLAAPPVVAPGVVTGCAATPGDAVDPGAAATCVVSTSTSARPTAH